MKTQQKSSSSEKVQVVANPLSKWLSQSECYALKEPKKENTKH